MNEIRIHIHTHKMEGGGENRPLPNQDLNALLVFDVSKCEPHDKPVVGYSKTRKMYVCETCMQQYRDDKIWLRPELEKSLTEMSRTVNNTLERQITAFGETNQLKQQIQVTEEQSIARISATFDRIDANLAEARRRFIAVVRDSASMKFCWFVFFY